MKNQNLEKNIFYLIKATTNVKNIKLLSSFSNSIFILIQIFILIKFCNSSFCYEFEGNGRRSGPILENIWNFQQYFDAIDYNKISNLEHAKIAAKYNLEYTKKIANKNITYDICKLKFSSYLIHKTAINFYNYLINGFKNSNAKFKLYKLKGDDSQGNVLFTGYYIPLLKASKNKNEIYKYPIYKFPKNYKPPLPTRYQIDKELALAGKDLEIAYCDDILDVYFLHVQGSGKLLFKDGREVWVSYDGKNNHPYRSIGKLLVERESIPAEKISLKTIREWMENNPQDLALLYENPSYVFFKETTHFPKGAANIKLVPLSSVAVDPQVIPLGSILLAEVPVLDSNGKLIDYSLKIFFAHDTGSAIKGHGRIDIFFGYGKLAGERAGELKHYGNLWLILCE